MCAGLSRANSLRFLCGPWARERAQRQAAQGRAHLLARSTDNGKTWSKPEVVVDTPIDDRDPSITVVGWPACRDLHDLRARAQADDARGVRCGPPMAGRRGARHSRSTSAEGE